MTIQDKYQRWVEKTVTLADLGYALRLLDWDAKVMMPSKGIHVRTRSHKYLAGLYHQLSTEPEYNELFEELSENESLTEGQRGNVSILSRNHKRRLKLPQEFVIRAAALYSEAYQQWLYARKQNDLSHFLPYLERIVELKQEEVGLAEYEGPAYEYFTSYFEPGLKMAEIDNLFHSFESGLLPLLSSLRNLNGETCSYFTREFPPDTQMNYCRQLIKDLGFDEQRGRLDLSEHPFTNGMTRNDVRITTRINTDQLAFSVWSTLHELGHALYEQHLPEDAYGLPLSLPASFGVHESQARFWENHIGRSMGFWEMRYPEWQDRFPSFLRVSLDNFYNCINRIQPNLIRTKADEIHYHFHIMIRYRVEKELLSGDLRVRDLKEQWNTLHKKYFDLEPANDNEGLLQDMHWSQGQWGYFPSYSIGSFLAAQLADSIEKHIPGYANKAGQGQVYELLGWLNEHVYRFGRTRLLQDLCVNATGKPIGTESFVRYIQHKYTVSEEIS